MKTFSILLVLAFAIALMSGPDNQRERIKISFKNKLSTTPLLFINSDDIVSYPDDTMIVRYLNGILDRLLIHAPEYVQKEKYYIFLLNHPLETAQAFPKGVILVYLGEILQDTSEDMLAFTLAHELGHIVLRHNENISSFGEIQRMVISNISGIKDSESNAFDMKMLKHGFFLKDMYEQYCEVVADYFAANLGLASGYNPTSTENAYRTDWNNIRKLQKNISDGDYFGDHPHPYIRAQIFGLSKKSYELCPEYTSYDLLKAQCIASDLLYQRWHAK